MIVTIMQPAYIPWSGFFHRAMLSDLFIVLDTVRMDKSSRTNFANRNKVLSPNGPLWLTIPLKRGHGGDDLPLRDLEILDDGHWRHKHYQALRHGYRRAPYFEAYRNFLEDYYAQPRVLLRDAIKGMFDFLWKELDLTTEVRYASAMDVAGTKDRLILNLCRAVGADTYISGPFGRTYLSGKDFADQGIRLLYHDFVPQPYPQDGRPFIPYLSALDVLLHLGPQAGAAIRSGQPDVDAMPQS